MLEIIFFLLVVLFIFIIVALTNKFSRENEEKYPQSQKEEEELPPLNFPADKIKKQEKPVNLQWEQQRLVNQYANSELMIYILNYVCDGNYQIYRPREIIINHENIIADVSGKRIIFDFVSNRVPAFTPIHYFSTEESGFIVKPQVAMANAINMLMGNEYEITDQGRYDYNWSERGTFRSYNYSSNYVRMRLKATKHF